MITFSVFRQLSETYPTFAEAKVIDFVEAESYSYKKHWYQVGEFTLVVPGDIPHIRDVKPDMMLLVADENISDSLMIMSVFDSGDKITIRGKDLKVLLSWRVTLFPTKKPDNVIEKPGTYGYDVATGSTGSVLWHYVDYNCVSSSDPNRNYYGLTGGDITGGREDDRYMSRLQVISDVAEELCADGDIGYDISILSDTESTISFDVITGEDRTNAGKGLRKYILADFTGDKASVEISSAEKKNCIWVVNGGSDVYDAVVTSIYTGDVSDTGYARRETLITANCDGADVELFAKKEGKSWTDKATLEAEIKDYMDYGRDFQVGDKITVIQKGTAYDKRVLQATKDFSGNTKRVTIVVGDIPALKPWGKITETISRHTDEIKEAALEAAEEEEGGVGKYADDNKKSEIFHVNGGQNESTGCQWSQVAGFYNKANGVKTSQISGNDNTVNGGDYSIISGTDNTVNVPNGSVVVANESTISNAISSAVFGQSIETVGNTSLVTSIVGGNGIKLYGSVLGSFIIGNALNLYNPVYCLATGMSSGTTGGAPYFDCHNYYRATFNSGPIELLETNGNLKIRGSFGSIGADYAEYFEWFDNNPENEDRSCRFVRLNGAKIELADREDDDVIGVVSINPSFVGDIGDMQADNSKKAAIGLLGKLIVEDDGSCTPNWYAAVGAKGTAKKAMCRTPFRVMERVDETHVKILVK